MKKVITLLVSVLLVFGLVGCGNKEKDEKCSSLKRLGYIYTLTFDHIRFIKAAVSDHQIRFGKPV